MRGLMARTRFRLIGDGLSTDRYYLLMMKQLTNYRTTVFGKQSPSLLPCQTKDHCPPSMIYCLAPDMDVPPSDDVPGASYAGGGVGFGDGRRATGSQAPGPEGPASVPG